jgi:hypothetical protein
MYSNRSKRSSNNILNRSVDHVYRPLGGLGPNIGSSEWVIARKKREALTKFAKDTETQNKALFGNMLKSNLRNNNDSKTKVSY